MARSPKLYQKLVRRRGGVGEHISLWIAADHVLQIRANVFVERYQRVRFADVHGFFILPSRESRWARVIGLILVVALGFYPLLDPAWQAAAIFSSCLGIVILVYGIFFARNCHFYVVTAVQRAEWANVARRRQARKLIARLEPLIREAQRAELEKVAGPVDGAGGASGS